VSTLLPSKATGWWPWVVLKAHTRNTAGNVTLRSVNPLDTPIVTFNSFDKRTTANNSD
jgi:choline dehydrogenase